MKRVNQSLRNFAIAEFIAKTSKLRNFRNSSQIFIIAADFPPIWGLDASCDAIAMRIQSKKGCFYQRIRATRLGYTA